MSVLTEFKKDLEKISAVSNVWIEEDSDRIHVKVTGPDYPNFSKIVDEYRGKGVTMIENDKGPVRKYVFTV